MGVGTAAPSPALGEAPGNSPRRARLHSRDRDRQHRVWAGIERYGAVPGDGPIRPDRLFDRSERKRGPGTLTRSLGTVPPVRWPGRDKQR